MMDIVEQLRKSANTIYSQDGYTFRLGLHNEAADELERLRREIDIAWAAGLFEGEGCITGTQKYRSQTNEDGTRRKSGFRWSLHVNSTDFDVLRKFAKIVGVEHFYGPYTDKRGDHYKPQLSWVTSTLEETQSVLRLLLPYLGERRAAKARECLEAKYERPRKNKAA